MTMSAFYGFVIVCLVGIASAEPRPGVCPDIETMPDFNISKFFGKWYEAKRYFHKSETNAKCVTAEYGLRNDSSLKFIHSQINSLTGKLESIEGNLHQPEINEPGKLKMKFPMLPDEGNLWILGTDYKNYLVIYSCRNKESSHVQSAWILTRDQQPSQFVINRALLVALKHNVDTKQFIDTDHTDCAVRME